MKLKYLFLTFIGAALFTACSDDTDTPPQPLGDTDAYISIGVTDGLAMTKATYENGDPENGEDNERMINNLTALVFDVNGNLVTIKDTANTANPGVSIDRIGHIKVRIADYKDTDPYSTTQFSVVLVANAKSNVQGATKLTDLADVLYTQPITDYKFSAAPVLPMVSEILTVKNLVKDSENWIKDNGFVVPGDHTQPLVLPTTGYGTDVHVPMTRLNARVELVALSAAFKDGAYEGATFRLDSVFLVNVRETSRFTDITNLVENTAAPFWRGSMEAFEVTNQHLVHPSNNMNAMLGKKYGTLEIKDQETVHEFDNDDLFVSYMFENNNVASTFTGTAVELNPYATRLVLMGNITSANGSDLGKRYYHIVLKNETGTGSNKVTTYVKHNTIYRVDATLTGTGSSVVDSIPLNAGIAAQVTLKDWYVIEQNATGEEDK